MGESVELTGMVLTVMPIGDYDKRITLLTKERGKITAFARGARRPGSQLLAATSPFSFGTFELFEGRNSYNVKKASIHSYFREMAMDIEAMYIGTYFLEFAEYYCQENNDEKEMLKLLYQSLRALESPAYPNRLVKVIFELKAMSIGGEGPEVFSCIRCRSRENLTAFSVRRGGCFCEKCRADAHAAPILDSTRYTMQYIISTPVSRLFSFKVSDEVLGELEQLMRKYMGYYVHHTFKALETLGAVEEFGV